MNGINSDEAENLTKLVQLNNLFKLLLKKFNIIISNEI